MATSEMSNVKQHTADVEAQGAHFQNEIKNVLAPNIETSSCIYISMRQFKWRGPARLFHISLPSFRLLEVCFFAGSFCSFFSFLSFVSLLLGLLVVIYCAHGMFPSCWCTLLRIPTNFLRSLKFSFFSGEKRKCSEETEKSRTHLNARKWHTERKTIVWQAFEPINVPPTDS